MASPVETTSPAPQDAEGAADAEGTPACAAPSLPPLLLGTYTPKIDAKGRVALPARMRSQLTDGMVMARGQERCVYLLPRMEFERVARRLQRGSLGSRTSREYLRIFLSGAVETEPDRQGRVLIPPMLRDYARLGEEIVVIGVGSRAEIWDRQAWEDYLAANEQDYADVANDVLEELEL